MTLCGFIFSAPALAADARISGHVVNNHHPVSGATVTLRGENVTFTTKSGADGAFGFPPLGVGSYQLSAVSDGKTARADVELSERSIDVELAILPYETIGSVVSTGPSTLHGSGSDVVFNHTAITQMPFNTNFSALQIQLPGAARGANNVVHLNGDHGVVNYMIDGVSVPQELNRDIGGEINLNDLSFIDVLEGAYPAQYGLRFGSVFNMATRADAGAPGFDVSSDLGSYATIDSTVGYHAPLARGGGFDVATSVYSTNHGLDPPDFSSPHNAASSVNQFARFAIPFSSNTYANLTLMHSHSTYEIPNDVDFGEPANTDDSETQEDTFAALQIHHAIDENKALSFGAAFHAGRIADFGDPSNDFAYGEALNVTAPPFGNGGTPSDCANAMANPQTFTATTCAFSLADTRTAIDGIVQAQYTQIRGKHTIGAGVVYDASRVLKDYAITLQPNNFLAPLLTPQTPDAPITVVDDAPNHGNTYQSYLQDSWRVSNAYGIDYGIRYDLFTIGSTDFQRGFGAFSPRFKLTRYWGSRASAYAYIGRFFEPFSLENVSPQAAYLVNLPLQPVPAQFDLKPERDTQLELGGHVPLGRGDLGFRVFQKNANDLIDDTQVGVTLLHQDINYTLGRISQEALNYTQPLPRNGRAYLSVAHTVSLNSGCETQLLAPCFGQPIEYTPADHEQRYSVTGGILTHDRRNGWLSLDGEYGSGLSSAVCPATTPGYCKETPHTTFDLEKGVAVSGKSALTFDIHNVLNDRYYVTLLNAQGNHYAAPRTMSIGFRYQP